MATLAGLAQIAEGIAENDRIHIWNTSAAAGARDQYMSPAQLRGILLGTANTWTAAQTYTGHITLNNVTMLRTKNSAGTDGAVLYMTSTDNLDFGRAVAADKYINFTPGNTSRMVLTGAGRLGVGITVPNYTVDVVGDINASGSVRSNGTPLTSDERLKDNVQPLADTLAKVKQARGVTFAWKGEKDAAHLGFVAQEIEAVFPDLVSEWVVDGETVKCVDYARMVPVLLEAVKELAGQVEKLAGQNKPAKG